MLTIITKYVPGQEVWYAREWDGLIVACPGVIYQVHAYADSRTPRKDITYTIYGSTYVYKEQDLYVTRDEAEHEADRRSELRRKEAEQPCDAAANGTPKADREEGDSK
jgi:hypothetical protein